MILKVTPSEDLKAGDFVLLLFNDAQVSCRKCCRAEPPDAVAKRDIGKGEILDFDSGQDTDDLARPATRAYDPEFW